VTMHPTEKIIRDAFEYSSRRRPLNVSDYNIPSRPEPMGYPGEFGPDDVSHVIRIETRRVGAVLHGQPFVWHDVYGCLNGWRVLVCSTFEPRWEGLGLRDLSPIEEKRPEVAA